MQRMPRGRAQYGVSDHLYGVLVSGLVELTACVARDPSAWGFGLRPGRRDVLREYQRLTRTSGQLPKSMLQDHRPLLELVPRDLPSAGGVGLATVLARRGVLGSEAAASFVTQLRMQIQARLGEPLDDAAIAQAAREAAWDHGLDASVVVPRVVRVVRRLVRGAA